MKNNEKSNTCVKCKALCCRLGGPAFTPEERGKVPKAGFKDYFIKSGKFYELKTKNGVCPYLKNYLCEIYKVRPLLCKTHPVYPVWKNKRKRYIVVDCPLTCQLSKNNIKSLKRMASKITKELMAQTLSGFDPVIEKRWKKFHWAEKVNEVFHD